MKEDLRLLRAKDCAIKTGQSVTNWWRWVRGGIAPRGRKISQGITVWRSDEVDEFIDQLVPRSGKNGGVANAQ